MGGTAGADEDHRRTPVAFSNTVAGKGISEHRHQRPVGRNHRRPEVGAGHAPPIGDPGAGDVGHLALFAVSYSGAHGTIIARNAPTRPCRGAVRIRRPARRTAPYVGGPWGPAASPASPRRYAIARS